MSSRETNKLAFRVSQHFFLLLLFRYTIRDRYISRSSFTYMIIISYYHKYWTASNCIIEDDSQWEKLISRNVEKRFRTKKKMFHLFRIAYRFLRIHPPRVFLFIRKKNYVRITILKVVGRIYQIMKKITVQVQIRLTHTY